MALTGSQKKKKESIGELLTNKSTPVYGGTVSDKKLKGSFDIGDALGNLGDKLKTGAKGAVDKVSGGLDDLATTYGDNISGSTMLGAALKSRSNNINYNNDKAKAEAELAALKASRPGDYTESGELKVLRGELVAAEKAKPGAFEDRYAADIDALLEKYRQNGEFKYDFASDPVWNSLSDTYQRNAMLGMKSAMGEAAGLTGGYGSSYSQQAGQQAYQQNISEMTDIIPQLADSALNRWQANQNQTLSNIAALQEQRDTEYGMWADEYNMWLTDRDYIYQKVENMSDDEFSRYLAGVERWNADRDYYTNEKNRAIENIQFQEGLDEERRQFNQEMLFNYAQLATDAAVDITTTGMSVGASLANTAADSALGFAQLAQDEKWNTKEFNEDVRRYNIGQGIVTQDMVDKSFTGATNYNTETYHNYRATLDNIGDDSTRKYQIDNDYVNGLLDDEQYDALMRRYGYN